MIRRGSRSSLIRPSVVSRVASGVGAGVVSACGVGFMLASDGAVQWWSLVFAVFAGLAAASVRLRGVWRVGDAIELRTVAGASRVPMASAMVIHIAPHASGIGVAARDGNVRMGEGTGASDQAVEEMYTRIRAFAAEPGVDCVEHGEVRSYVEATRGYSFAGWSVAAVARAMNSVEVWVAVAIFSALNVSLTANR